MVDIVVVADVVVVAVVVVVVDVVVDVVVVASKMTYLLFLSRFKSYFEAAKKCHNPT